MAALRRFNCPVCAPSILRLPEAGFGPPGDFDVDGRRHANVRSWRVEAWCRSEAPQRPRISHRRSACCEEPVRRMAKELVGQRHHRKWATAMAGSALGRRRAEYRVRWAVAPCSRRRWERLMFVVLSMFGLLGLGIGCFILVRYQTPWRRIARDRRRESAAYRRRMAERHGVDASNLDG